MPGVPLLIGERDVPSSAGASFACRNFNPSGVFAAKH
jgi:hypothetical protein